MALFADIAALLDEGRPFVLATVIASSGSTPQKPGTRLLVLEGGEVRGTVGGGAIEQQVVDAALALLASPSEESALLDTHLTHDLGMCCGGKMTLFLERHGAPHQLWLFGAGHVAKDVAGLAAQVGFRVTVCDEREALLTAARFPLAQRRLAPPDEVAKALVGDGRTYCCVTTHDHALDQACVEALAGKPLAYLGVIGSQRKGERTRTRLRQAGLAEAAVARVDSPMGLPIGARSTMEIALSIVAKLVARRAKCD